MYKYLSSGILLLSSVICFVIVVMIEQKDKLNLSMADCENPQKWPNDNNTCGVWSGGQCLKGEINGLNCVHKSNTLGILLLALSLVFLVLSITSFIHNYRS